MKVSGQSQNSIALLSHLRWLSALAVVLSHVKQDLILKPGFTPTLLAHPNLLEKKDIFRPEGYGHAAVVVFFVLSGFLVGGKLIELAKSENIRLEWRGFFIDRVVRIFVVLWPALLLTFIVCFTLVTFLPNAPFVSAGRWAYDLEAPLSADLDLGKWSAAATLMNEIISPTLLCNGPLWSLSYEWAYYMIALAGVLVLRGYFSLGSVPLILYGLALLCLAALHQPDILFAGFSWVAGAVARAVYNHDMLRGVPFRILGVTLVLLVLALDHRHPLPDPVLGTALAFMIAHSDWKRWTFQSKLGDYLAAFSYSLYLTHFPMLLAVMGVLYAAGTLPPHPLHEGATALVIASATVLFLVLFSRSFAWMTEDRTVAIRRALLRISGSRPAAPVVAVGGAFTEN